VIYVTPGSKHSFLSNRKWFILCNLDAQSAAAAAVAQVSVQRLALAFLSVFKGLLVLAQENSNRVAFASLMNLGRQFMD
jgi:hypothetical protein